MASEMLLTISKEEREQAWLRSREKYELDTQSKLTYAKLEGKQEGIEIGEQKGRVEEREYFLNLLNQGLSIDEIKQQLTVND